MLETTLALALFLFPLAYSPGPGNLFFAAIGARFGFRASLPASAGYHVATWLVTLALGLGASAAFTGAPGLFWALKLAGAAYVLRLAAGFFFADARADLPDAQSDAQSGAQSATFRDGAVLLLLNPKAYVIIALMFSQFLDETGGQTTSGPALGPVIAITSLFTLNNLIAFSLWTAVGARLARLFAAERSAQALNRVFGALLALVGLWMLLG